MKEVIAQFRCETSELLLADNNAKKKLMNKTETELTFLRRTLIGGFRNWLNGKLRRSCCLRDERMKLVDCCKTLKLVKFLLQISVLMRRN